jgi:hypothetical protein
VILDNIGRATTRSGEVFAFGQVTPEQIEWLKKDLSHVGGSRPIALVTHIPTLGAFGVRYGLDGEVMPPPSDEKGLEGQDSDFPDTLDTVFKKCNLKLVLSGHQHVYRKIPWKMNEHDILFVMGGAISGQWWKEDQMITDSSSRRGFTEVSVDAQAFDATYIPYGQQGVKER